MSGVTRVVGPVDPEAARWAASLNDPAAGRLAIIVPPGLPSLAALVGELLGAMGKRPDRNPLGAVAAETLELGLAWLAGHAVDRVILVHADWLREDVAADLGAYAALSGIELVCVVGGGHRDAFAPWATSEAAWFEFVARETAEAGARSARAGDPRHHQLDGIGPLGRPAGLAVVAAQRLPEGPALAAYVSLVGRIRLDGRTDAAVANSVRLVLRTFDGAGLPDAVRGAAAALSQAGWRLVFDPPTTGADPGPAWVELRTPVHPYQAAAVALVAAGLWVSDLPSVAVSDVAPDGSTVRRPTVTHPVPPGARAYLVAQRRLAVGEAAPFLTHRGRRLTAAAAEDAVTASMSEAGATIDGRLLHAPATPGLRWLAARGLTLRRAEVTGEAVRMDRRCRHGVAGEFEVDGILLGHSQKLCGAHGAADRHPWALRSASAGFALEEVERSALGIRIAVTRDGVAAGELVGLDLGGGRVWIQVGVGSAPALRRIADVVAERYRLRAGVAGRT